MIVTVCYGRVRVVVPCGDGSLKVDELKELANERYNKAIGRPRESHVPVHHLQTQSGILDPDDQLATVVGDKEQIFVCFEDDPRVPQGGGDGASGSSAGTGSPDIFRGDAPDAKSGGSEAEGANGGAGSSVSNAPHIEVTSLSAGVVTIGGAAGLGMLQVRRSSDPSLNAIGGVGGALQPLPVDPTKRWSAAAVCRSDQLLMLDGGQAGAPTAGGSSTQQLHYHHLSPSWEDELELMDGSAGGHDHDHDDDDDDDDGHEHNGRHHLHAQQPDSLQPGQFSRSNRLSMQFVGQDAHSNGYRWIDAADRAAATASAAAAAAAATTVYTSKSLPRDATKRKEPLGQAYESIREKNDEMLLIVNETGGPLGLTAVPDPHNGGLLVQHVEPGSRAERGRLHRGDRILEINGTKLVGMSEVAVQEHLRSCCGAPELRVRVIRAATLVRRLQRELGQGAEARVLATPVSPSKKATASTGTGSTASAAAAAASATTTAGFMQTANTRKIGRKFVIVLRKGAHGLGFSVTTRDNPAGGQCPIYIKTILPRGAAIVDGRLKPGDRLLEVDGVSVTGRTQSDVVQMLRATKAEASVEIVVSRQQQLESGGAGAVAESASEQMAAERASDRVGDEREIGYGDQTNAPPDTNTPPKPPAPIFPPYKSHALKKPAGNALTEQNVRRHFIDTGSESVSSTAESGPRKREILTLHIPVHDTEKAGLGVSVKGKTGSNNSSNGSGHNGGGQPSSGSNTSGRAPAHHSHDGDLGIFVKSVLNGGAASLDGRLRMNDQLLYVNEISLLDQSNEEAMETLRKAMLQRSGTYPGTITLTVSRRIASRPHSQLLAPSTVELGGVSVNGSFDVSHTRSVSSTSEQSGKTVIYLSAEKLEGEGAPASALVSPENGAGNAANSRSSWKNPVLDRLTGGTGHIMHISTTPPQKPLKPKSASTLVQQQKLQQQQQQHQQQQQQREFALRNESYYMATNETWSPMNQQQANSSVLIEEDPEPPSPTVSMPRIDALSTSATSAHHNHGQHHTSTTSANASKQLPDDAPYDSQLSLDTNPDAFTRDAIGRRSMSEKHHAALDAKETGTYQRNKKAREQREQRDSERRVAHFKRGAAAGGSGHHRHHHRQPHPLHSGSSMESLPTGGGGDAAAASSGGASAAARARALAVDEALDSVGELGPSLGLKKSSSLESLQTMVQEIQMSDEPQRGPSALRTPRGRGREASLRAAVESRPEANKPRKHWLLEDAPSDTEGGFIKRHGPFQCSLNEGKHKALMASGTGAPTASAAAAAAAAAASAARHKKSSGGGLLKGIGHMFRFGKHRKDGIAPTETYSDLGPHMHDLNPQAPTQQPLPPVPPPQQQHGQPIYQTRSAALLSPGSAAAGGDLRPLGGPPNYQPPPPVGNGVVVVGAGFALHQNDPTFNQRYTQSLYLNHAELQQQLGQPHPLTTMSPPQAPLPPTPPSQPPQSATLSPTVLQQQQQQLSPLTAACGSFDLLSESTMAQMRQQVMHQRVKVEEESRRNQHYHSQRSASSRKIDYNNPHHPHHHHQQQQQQQHHLQHGSPLQPQQSQLSPHAHHHHHQPMYNMQPLPVVQQLHVGKQQQRIAHHQLQQQPPHHHQQHHQRPVSSYYGEYATVHKYEADGELMHTAGGSRKTSAPSSPLKLAGGLGNSGRYQHAAQQQRL